MGACVKAEDEVVEIVMVPGEIPALPAWKRFLDLVCIVVAAPIVIPLAGIIAAYIKGFAKGSILFRQERVGLRGRRFTCLKFRTMEVGANAKVHDDHVGELIKNGAPLTKIDEFGDARLVPLGGLLRASGLDELPQLWNVLRREMSLVGPRPCTVYEYEQFDAEQRMRFQALPGITGKWQTNGKNETTFDEMVRLDIEYVYEKTFWGDLKILIKTLPVVVGQLVRGARKKAKDWRKRAYAQPGTRGKGK